ncbi:RDD family protein [Pseudonocardia thermophila]|jgi:RDD family.|uniref:RDD family protein n=1 Tax=Pseudonocardia thermophila TaxID=1848 RepID=A0A1M6XBG7_PSETH|nr:RDD family protein [Pseudonocardia thermophila]SHL03273.1 RDD family protein [Pseudonocardia thermophila]
MHDEAAPFWPRLLARLFDLTFSLMAVVVLALLVRIVLLPHNLFISSDGEWIDIGIEVGVLLVFVGLEAVLLAKRRGRTIGMGLLGLRVVPVNPAAPGISLPVALLRSVVLYLPLVLIRVSPDTTGHDLLSWLGTAGILANLALAAARTSTHGRTIHDHLAGTRVIVDAERGTVPHRRGVDLRERSTSS